MTTIGPPTYNYPAFNAAAAKWRAEGHYVHNPAESFGGDTTRAIPVYMRADLHMLLDVDAIALLPNWTQSTGATKELLIAQMLGLDVYDAILLTKIEPPEVLCYPVWVKSV
jgi:hypothetical protein